MPSNDLTTFVIGSAWSSETETEVMWTFNWKVASNNSWNHNKWTLIFGGFK